MMNVPPASITPFSSWRALLMQFTLVNISATLFLGANVYRIGPWLVPASTIPVVFAAATLVILGEVYGLFPALMVGSIAVGCQGFFQTLLWLSSLPLSSDGTAQFHHALVILILSPYPLATGHMISLGAAGAAGFFVGRAALHYGLNHWVRTFLPLIAMPLAYWLARLMTFQPAFPLTISTFASMLLSRCAASLFLVLVCYLPMQRLIYLLRAIEWSDD